METTSYNATRINGDIAQAYAALDNGLTVQYPGGDAITEDQLDDIVSEWRADGEPGVEGPVYGWTGDDVMLPCGRVLIIGG
jgi:hypothetical protein